MYFYFFIYFFHYDFRPQQHKDRSFFSSLLKITFITLVNNIWSVVFSSLLTSYSIMQVSHFVDSLVYETGSSPSSQQREICGYVLITSVKIFLSSWKTPPIYCNLCLRSSTCRLNVHTPKCMWSGEGVGSCALPCPVLFPQSLIRSGTPEEVCSASLSGRSLEVRQASVVIYMREQIQPGFTVVPLQWEFPLWQLFYLGNYMQITGSIRQHTAQIDNMKQPEDQ